MDDELQNVNNVEAVVKTICQINTNTITLSLSVFLLHIKFISIFVTLFYRI